MKNVAINLIDPLKLALLLFFLTITISCCNKDDDNPPPDPVGQLPPATQTGAGTFGCLLDGEVFLPGNTPNNLDCVYQFVNGGYYFTLQSNRRINGSELQAIAILSNDFQIEEGFTYDLKENIPNNVTGLYRFNFNSYYTNNINTGKLTITKLDYTNHIISGTFWFDVIDSNNVVHQVRDGRFDVRFTE